MLKKFGINSTRAEKSGRVVKNAIEEKRAEKLVVCSCGKKFVKSCPSEEVCEISILKCPHCGADIC